MTLRERTQTYMVHSVGISLKDILNRKNCMAMDREPLFSIMICMQRKRCDASPHYSVILVNFESMFHKCWEVLG